MFNIKKYELVQFIGRGSFGDVYKYTSSSTVEGEMQDVAVKKLGILAEDFDVKSCREIQTITNVNHLNIVRFLGYCVVDLQIALAMELCLGDLEKLIESRRSFGEHEVAFLVHQICQGLAYLHQNYVIHRDIKPKNILTNCAGEMDLHHLVTAKKMVLKIADFGLSKLLDDDATSETMTRAGTSLYMAPEVRDAKGNFVHYSMRADVYSLGLVAYNLLRKDLRQLIPGSQGIGEMVLEQEGLNPMLISSFFSSCLQHEPANRETSTKLLEHPFFEETLFQNISDASLWEEGDTCTAVHYSKPSKMIIGMADGKVIIYDMRAMTKEVQKLCESQITSIHSNESYVVVGSSDTKAPVTILSRKNDAVVKKLEGHTAKVQCVNLTNEYLATVGDDERMFLYSIPSWNMISEVTREGFARYQCVSFTGNVLTAIDNKRVKQYKLTHNSCEEIAQLNLKEPLFSIAADPEGSNVYWVGAANGSLKKVNLKEKRTEINLQIKEGRQVYQIKHLKQFVVCLLKEPGTGELGPVAAFIAGRQLSDIQIEHQDLATFGPLETSAEWLIYIDGRENLASRKVVVEGSSDETKCFEIIRKSIPKIDSAIEVVHFADPDLMLLGLSVGNMSAYSISGNDMALIVTREVAKTAIRSIDSNGEFVVLAHGKGLESLAALGLGKDLETSVTGVSVLRKDGFDIVHRLEIHNSEPRVQLSSKFLVVDVGLKLLVSSPSEGWRKIAELKLKNTYFSKCRSTLSHDLLTLVDGKAVKQCKLSSDGCKELVSITVIKAGGKLHWITPDLSNASEFWVGTDKGAIIKANMEKKEVATRVECGLKILQCKWLKDFLLCFLDDKSIVAYETKDLVGLGNRTPPSFRQVCETTSEMEIYFDLGLVLVHGKVFKAVSIGELRDKEKTEMSLKQKK